MSRTWRSTYAKPGVSKKTGQRKLDNDRRRQLNKRCPECEARQCICQILSRQNVDIDVINDCWYFDGFEETAEIDYEIDWSRFDEIFEFIKKS
ncbi:MAG: hypothetical protein GF349_00820 [Candidatus Magasanikbacteria bacterium]|nr:hypothetical protein [Candidatus Magasanikbacteria bacterium]